MKEFIEYIIKKLVDKPDEVRINVVAGEHTTVLELHVADGDLGKVIGRHGQTAMSIRTLLLAAAARQHKRCVLEILDNDKE
ncbi:KH domain-containing protein [bacterium]|nr:KH domain-containing protein [bacterium]